VRLSKSLTSENSTLAIRGNKGDIGKPTKQGANPHKPS
jgi:hypothetical protein